MGYKKEKWVTKKRNGLQKREMGYKKEKWVTKKRNGLQKREMGYKKEKWVTKKRNQKYQGKFRLFVHSSRDGQYPPFGDT